MIVNEYVKQFEKHGFGMFVHFGIYSVHGKGEWAKHTLAIPDEEYDKALKEFCPKADWAKELVATAKAAGCKYITLTTRHHDGFSMYDTLGLNDYDAPHSACGRDLVREFVDACNAEGIVPFFYHTLLDWREESYRTDFKKYLAYLRRSIEILCTQYGKIGGLWFDGMWEKPNEDWEEDALYGLIRKYQPEAMIINNTGLSALGALGHIELDSVTFERGNPSPINLADSPKYIASEMCEIFADHWGYAARDFNYKSLAQMIRELCLCRRYGSNMLLNVGPMANGELRLLDKAMLRTLGEWVALHEEALRLPRPCGIEVQGDGDDFLLQNGAEYYLFRHNLPMAADPNVAIGDSKGYQTEFRMPEKIRSMTWLDDGSAVKFTQDGDKVTVYSEPFRYGGSLVVRIAKIST